MQLNLTPCVAALALIVSALPSPLAAETLVPRGAVWKYNDTGADLGTGWSAPGYADAGWNSGLAQLGYGDGDEATSISWGADANNKLPCYYFRHAFVVADPAAFGSLTLDVLRDDGCVVYLNGAEVARDNMPAGAVSYRTWAASAIEDTTYHSFTADAALLQAGVNVLAVEVHQSGPTSSDVSFDLGLTGNAAGVVTFLKGPYLQRVTADGVVVRWETDQAVAGRVDLGTAAPNEFSVVETTPTTLHEVALSGLAPNTLYQYIATAGLTTTPVNRFMTAPATADVPFRFAAYGDTRTYPADHAAVVRSMIAHDPDFVLHVGDFATDGRIYDEWGPQFFDPAADLIKAVPLFPALGNHEYSGTGPLWYLDFFSVPSNGSARNVGHWYAFTYGSARFIALNACEGGDTFTPGSEQYNWLVSELTSAAWLNARWRFVFDHNPPFTAMERDNAVDQNLRTYLVPLFEQSNVDVVFSGDDHQYRHSLRNGIHYIVTGGGGAPLHDVGTPMDGATLIYAEKTYQHCIVDITPTSLDFYAARPDGSVLDSFSLTRDGLPSVPTGLTATPGDAQVALSWNVVAGAAAYNIKRAAASGGPYVVIGSSVSPSYVDHQVANGTTCFYVVSATNAQGESGDSAEVAATPACPPPAAPTGLQATPGNAQVSLAWTASADAASYEVKRAQPSSGGVYSTITTGLTGTAYTDATAVNGTTYSYLVVARNACGLSTDSVSVSATPQAPLAAPLDLTATSTKKGQVGLRWSASPGATSYSVKRATTSGGPYTLVKAGVATTAYKDTGLKSGTTVYYVVVAVNVSGSSPNSNQVSVRVK